MMWQIHAVGTAHVDVPYTLDLRGIAKTLAINQTAAGGVATAALTVEGSTDGTNFLLLDSIAAAATVTKQYVEATVGGTLALSPLSFRYVRITSKDGGAAVVATIDIAVK